MYWEEVKHYVARTLLLGLLLSLGMAQAASAVTPQVKIGEVVTGPAANAFVTSTADCGGTFFVTGGGISLTTSGPGSTGSSQRLEGTGPSTTSPNFLTTNPSSNAHRWLAIDGAGGMSDPAGKDSSFAICDNGFIGANGTTIRVNSISGPTTSLTAATAARQCSANERLLSGGGYATPPVGSNKLIASYPILDEAHATTPLVGSSAATGWAAVGWEGGGVSAGDKTWVYVVCTNAADIADYGSLVVTAAYTDVAGPTVAHTPQPATKTCPAGVAIGGGFALSVRTYGGSSPLTFMPSTTSSGDHLIGSFPSNASGAPPTANGNAPASWTSVGRTGGSTDANDRTAVWAMCATGT